MTDRKHMVVFSVSVRKVEETDLRFPGWDAVKHANGKIVGFSSVYLCEMQTSDGPKESPFFVTDAHTAREPMQEVLATMLSAFSKAVREAAPTETEKAA